MDERRRLMDQLAGERAPDLSGFQAKAFDLLTSAATLRAFQIDREPAKVRDAYGRNIYGQSVLLARRLIEAGTRVACISWAPDANATWDTHGGNFVKLKNELLPKFDAACTSRAAAATRSSANASSDCDFSTPIFHLPVRTLVS